jgi:preprotein translocase subunit SecA
MASSEIPVLGPMLSKLFGTRNERLVKKYSSRVDLINEREDAVRPMSDAELRELAADIRERFKSGAKWDAVLPEAFAVAREAMDRNVGIRNVFNPEHRERFAADKLSDEHRRLWQETCERIDAMEDGEPTGELLGNQEPVPAWKFADVPHELYQAVREIYPESKPPFRSRPFDVQLIGAMVLYEGSIAEMKTGEGKTIVAPLASFLAALEGFKVHVVTVNDYLVQRDRDWVFPFFRALGMTVGAIHPMHMQPEDMKRQMYGCDVVYGTTSEFGFDYLRDNMKRSVEQQVQRYREFAIVDEVDSTLIDEARTPLIISGQAHEEQPRYDLADKVARHLKEAQKAWDAAEGRVEACKREIKATEGDIRNARDKDKIPELQQKLKAAQERLPRLEAERDEHPQFYEVQKDRKKANLTHEGVSEAQRYAQVGSLYVGQNTDLPHLIEQAVRAHVVYERDTDYVVMALPDQATGRNEPDVVIVDQNTGRAMVGRQWSDGLHQAAQAKEGLRIRPETQTVASITIQNFFKMYKRLAGMTGTADTEAQEFHDIYGLEVVSIPTNVPVIRNDFNDVVYLSEKDKWSAVVDEIVAMHDAGRPVLVGTTSVETSETLSGLLAKQGSVKHEVLNAKQHEREANIVANAGQLGAVMIATNMAGRGTDIKLGSATREELREHWLRRGIAPRELSVEDDEQTLREKVFRKIAQKELGMSKRDAESADAGEIELALLRGWAMKFTREDPKRIERTTDPDELRAMLDDEGRFALHRLDWEPSMMRRGGLHVIGTERHESRRIDNQLRGRAGRQGDKGSSRFFVSLEDPLMKMFAGETMMKMLSRVGMKEGDAIEAGMLSKSIARAQRKVEERNFQWRKQILEYDEVMEHQRREFYGLRQRVLDGRDLRGLVFEFIEDATREAIEKYLDTDYFGERVAQYAAEALGVSVPAERLRGKERDELEDVLRQTAREEAAHEISVTVGEYLPGSGDIALVDVDEVGLNSWARERFDTEIPPAEIEQLGTRGVTERLNEAAAEKIDRTPLEGLSAFAVENYGANELSKWLRETLGIDVPVETITKAETREDLLKTVLGKVSSSYDEREKAYPVEFNMELTQALMAQDPPRAVANLLSIANDRFGLGWDESVVRSKNPQQVGQELLEASRRFVEEGRLDKAVDEATAITDPDELENHVQERYGRGLPFWMVRLKDDEFRGLTRALIESILRPELVQFERFVLLEVLDPAWKDHLYQMDQLRESIGFRAFSQQDPRIEYKREGARMFREMMNGLHEKVARAVFRMRLRPQVGPPPGTRRPQQQMPQRPPAQPPAANPAQRAAQERAAQAGGMGSSGGGGGGGGIVGPGFSG